MTRGAAVTGDAAIERIRARLLGRSLLATLPAFHDHVPVYGSGCFTNYPLERLAGQLAGWVDQGIPRVTMKISRHPEEDPARLAAARKAIGDEPALMTDSNGACGRKQALDWARRLRAEYGVCWLEEPVSSDDIEGLRLLRDRGPAGLDIAAGEYGIVLPDFAGLLAGGAVDCLQADATAADAARYQVHGSTHALPS